jgi:hypothetical protein
VLLGVVIVLFGRKRRPPDEMRAGHFDDLRCYLGRAARALVDLREWRDIRFG